MILLHLDIDETGQAAFRADAPSPPKAGGTQLVASAGSGAVATSCDPPSLLLEAVQSVVWFTNEVEPTGDGRVATSTRNLLMFLSDVRDRKFKRGIFLGDDILQLAETFRAAARTVAAGQFLPDLEEWPDGFHAIWRAIGEVKGDWEVKGERRKVKGDVESDHPSPFTLHLSPFSSMPSRAALGARRWKATPAGTRPCTTPGSPPCAATRGSSIGLTPKTRAT